MNVSREIVSTIRRGVSLVLMSGILTIPLLVFPVAPVHALTSVQSLQAQKKAAEEKAKAAAAAAQKQKELAAQAAEKVKEVSSQIQDLQGAIQDTQQNLTSTQQEIEQKNQEVASLESDLSRIQSQLDALVRQLYISWLSMPDDLALYSNESISKREQKQAQFMSLKKSVAVIYSQTQDAKMSVEQKRADLIKKNTQLGQLQDQQTSEKKVLAVAKFNQQDLQQNATSAAQRLNQEAEQAKAQAAAIDAKIRTLTTTSNWGNGIVSGSPTGWYYSQTGNYTRLGYSPYTISEYGCLITSIAMVATYYGHSISPSYIAQRGVFDGGGSLIKLPGGIGVSVGPSSAVNWGVVGSQVNSGHPVIVSIYLPSVGAINSDGSSHFVVIYGMSDGKYLMQDPIAPGRSYSLNQVRSMKLVSQN
jgi:hypothetical protein